MDDKDKITLDRETFRALAADSRIEILKKLDEHKLTLTDLKEKLDMSPSTVKEHLDRLTAAGLIELIPGDTKWKYYRLTRKGRNILNPYETKVWFVLVVTAVALLGVVYNLFGKILAFNLFVQNKVVESVGESPVSQKAVGELANGGDLLASAPAENATAEAVRMLATSMNAASTTTTTVVQAVAAEMPEISHAASGIPLSEVVLALLLMLVLGLCVGVLIKKRRFI